jgi:hypothetical protein
MFTQGSDERCAGSIGMKLCNTLNSRANAINLSLSMVDCQMHARRVIISIL